VRPVLGEPDMPEDPDEPEREPDWLRSLWLF
jgi:hypothetical protein